MRLDVVVPVYAPNEFLLRMATKALGVLRECSDARVIVVDNGWDWDRPDDLPCDEYVRLRENRGYAGGVNVGLGMTQTETIGVGSIDVFVKQGWQEPMILAAMANQGIASPAARRYQYDVDTGEHEAPECCFWGGLFVMDRAVYQGIGGLDETNFRLRYSDTDYAVRAAKAGFWVGRVPEVWVEHRDPSVSTLLMPAEEQEREWDRLREIHGKFDPYTWKLERFR